MPPLAKNVIHEAAMEVMRQWIASPLEVLSVYFGQDSSHLKVRFNSHVDPATATVAANYSLDQNQVITDAVMGAEPDTVILPARLWLRMRPIHFPPRIYRTPLHRLTLSGWIGRLRSWPNLRRSLPPTG